MSDQNDVMPPPPSAGPSADERQWGMIAHLSSLSGLVTGGVGCVVGPLVVWLVKKDTMPFVDDQGKEALNFNITFAGVSLALWILTVGTLGIGIVLTGPAFAIAFIAWLVLTIIALMKANEGERYRYPFAIRLLK